MRSAYHVPYVGSIVPPLLMWLWRCILMTHDSHGMTPINTGRLRTMLTVHRKNPGPHLANQLSQCLLWCIFPALASQQFAPRLQTAIQRFTTSLPTWAALSNATWAAGPRFDPAADPLPLLRSFNDSAMARVHRSRPRLPSGAFGQNGAPAVMRQCPTDHDWLRTGQCCSVDTADAKLATSQCL